MSEDEWYVNAVVVTWSHIAGKQYIPLAIKDVILIAIETKEETPARLSNEEMEVCIAKWRALPKSFHNDQLNMADLGFYLQKNTWRSYLQ